MSLYKNLPYTFICKNDFRCKHTYMVQSGIDFLTLVCIYFFFNITIKLIFSHKFYITNIKAKTSLIIIYNYAYQSMYVCKLLYNYKKHETNIQIILSKWIENETNQYICAYFRLKKCICMFVCNKKFLNIISIKNN